MNSVWVCRKKRRALPFCVSLCVPLSASDSERLCNICVYVCNMYVREGGRGKCLESKGYLSCCCCRCRRRRGACRLLVKSLYVSPYALQAYAVMPMCVSRGVECHGAYTEYVAYDGHLSEMLCSVGDHMSSCHSGVGKPQPCGQYLADLCGPPEPQSWRCPPGVDQDN
jgi:hypothetical protein